MYTCAARAAVLPLAVFPLILLAGCDGVTYLAQLAQGELEIVGQTEPIEAVLSSGRLSESDAEKLQLIVDAREFAVHTLGLNASKTYTTFYDSAGDPIAFNLSAARQDTLVAKTWTFPIVGEVPYLAFFDEDLLHRTEQQLIDAGYDTLSYELDTYSTLGLLDNPVRSPMLRRGTLSLAETVIHELLHETVYRTSSTVFNESLATFVGRQGAVEFLRARYGDASGWPEVAAAYYADTDKVNVFLMQAYADLVAYYAQPLSSTEKIAGREAVYQAARDRFVAEVQPTLNYPDLFSGYASLPTNNARMLGNYRYNLDLSVFRSVYDATGQNWPATLAVFRAAAGTAGDPFEYLHTWRGGQP